MVQLDTERTEGNYCRRIHKADPSIALFMAWTNRSIIRKPSMHIRGRSTAAQQCQWHQTLNDEVIHLYRMSCFSGCFVLYALCKYRSHPHRLDQLRARIIHISLCLPIVRAVGSGRIPNTYDSRPSPFNIDHALPLLKFTEYMPCGSFIPLSPCTACRCEQRPEKSSEWASRYDCCFAVHER